jgi:hypothetical protein
MASAGTRELLGLLLERLTGLDESGKHRRMGVTSVSMSP